MLGSKFRLSKLSVFSFISKIFWFLLIGASGFVINYLLSHALVHGPISYVWYIHGTIIGIIVSTTSNFLLNKIITFRDLDFGKSHLFKQYMLYGFFTLFGSGIQLSIVWSFVELGHSYSLALLTGVIMGAFSNFLLNKKWTFQEKIWN